jgi:hypothetical protein
MSKSLRSLPSVVQTSTTISRLHLLENGCTFAELFQDVQSTSYCFAPCELFR